MKKPLLILLTILLMPTLVNASLCTNAEKVSLGKLATDIKVGYEEKEGIVDPSTYLPPEGYTTENYVVTYPYFVVKVNNIPENLDVVLKNEKTQEEIEIKYKDTLNGTYEYSWKDLDDVTKFSYRILGDSTTSCSLEVLKKGIITLPAYNRYYTSQRCDKAQGYSLCEKFINTSLDYETFTKKVDKYIEEKEKKQGTKEAKPTKKKYLEFIKKNSEKIILISVISIIAIGSVITIIVRKRRRRAI